MKKENIIYFLFSIIFIMSCNKHDTETIKKDYKKITIVRTSFGYSGAADSLIIELNNNSTIKSIKTYTFGLGTISAQIIKNFIYQPNSNIPDSSVIETKDWRGITDKFTEKYLYENGKIVNVYSPLFENGRSYSLIIYTYNLEGKIVNKSISYTYHQDTLYSNLKFEYNGNNLSSSTDEGGDQNKYITFDDKINPLNDLFRKCNFPINDEINGLFPPEYLFSENNPIKMKLGSNSIGININQTYKYNQFNYPIEVNSNWGYYNLRFYYE